MKANRRLNLTKQSPSNDRHHQHHASPKRRMPPSMRYRIRNAYNLIRTLPEDTNPVQKRFLIVSVAEAHVHITVAATTNNQNNNSNNNNIGGMGAGAADPNAVHARLHALEVSKISFREEIHRNQQETARLLHMVNCNVTRIAVQPGVRRANNNNNAAEPGGLAVLSANPRTLHVLWQEYNVGIGGRKPARLFTAQERGRSRYKYHRRKVVWDVIARLVRSGRTAQTAIDMIYATYGHQSVTSIINRMRRDRANGGHPNLQ